MVAVAVVSLVVLAYTYVGYPILIAALAKVAPVRLRTDDDHTPMVSVIIPVYNAVEYIPTKLESLLALDYPPDQLEILLCSDCSDDGSDELLAEYAARDPRIVVLRAERRSGKPSAVNLMRRRARGEVLLMTDIRQPLARGALRELVRVLADPSVGAVSGNLVLRGQTGAGVYWRYENWIRSSEGAFRSMVGVTGPIYAIRAADMADMPTDIVLDDMWVPMRLRLDGRRIAFARGAEAFDDAFGDGRELGRKVRTLAGNYQLFARLPKLLLPVVNPSWFETFSHKVLRLVCPWALLALLVSTAALVLAPPDTLGAPALRAAQVLLAGQVLFYLGALLGDAAGALGRTARTFVVLNYAAVAGLWRFVRSSQKVTW